jgi:hypothetical protein
VADVHDSPDLDAVMGEAEEREARARSEREEQVREHNQRVFEAHQAQAALQAELADRAVAAVPMAVEAGTSWWSRRGHLVGAGFAGAASLWALEWAAWKIRLTVRGRR